jgi:diaminohydroxyphosphoribosylaminopyrimidine deaminase/5-amino-6-(5-phosphoribosylamino)uracil reductase
MSDSLTHGDRSFLSRAIDLAMRGRGTVEPNPMVGCVIVRDGRTIGEGYTSPFGGPHAEPNALAACTESPAGATAYVTLEPCCHTKKKTPPCVPQLIAAKLGRVVVGCNDPNPEVDGRGNQQLRDAGIQVTEANDPACRQLLAPFIALVTNRRPYITLKWAQSADGKVAGPGGRRTQISNRTSQEMIHALRARSDAILIGIATAVADNPLLTARDVAHSRPLVRMVLDSDLRLSIDSKLVKTAGDGKVILFCSKEAADYSGTRVPLAACGVEIDPVSAERPGRLSLPAVMKQIGKMNLTHLIVEPGPTLARSFLESGLWDRAWIIRSPMKIDHPTAPAAASLNGIETGSRNLGDDVLTEYLNPEGVFSAALPSADLKQV